MKRPVVIPLVGACDAVAGVLGALLGAAALGAAWLALAIGEDLLSLATLIVGTLVLAQNTLLFAAGIGLLLDRSWARGLALAYGWWGLVAAAGGLAVVVAGALLVLVAGFGVPPAPVDDPSSFAWLVPLLLLTPFLGAPFPALQLVFCHLASVRRHFGAGVAAARTVASPAPAPEESPVTNTTRILAFAGSAREASLNKKLVRVAAEGARAAGAEVTLIDLRDLPMPIYDGDLEEAEGLPPNARELKRLLREHDGLLLACPEYNSSITPLLKNAIDWASRAEEGEKPLACFKGKVAGLLAASPGGLGGLRGLVTVRSILGNIGVLVIPEQVVVPKAAEVFDEQGRLASDKQRASVERIGRRVAEVAGQLSPRAG